MFSAILPLCRRPPFLFPCLPIRQPKKRSPSFGLMERRVVGEQAAPSRSLVSLHLHSTGGGGGDGGSGGGSRGAINNGDGSGAPFHAYVADAGPGFYTPDMSAPPLPNEGRRRRGRAKQLLL